MRSEKFFSTYCLKVTAYIESFVFQVVLCSTMCNENFDADHIKLSGWPSECKFPTAAACEELREDVCLHSSPITQLFID